MKTCPACGSNSTVIDSRSVEGGARVRRRRTCDGCGRRWTTSETEELSEQGVARIRTMLIRAQRVLMVVDALSVELRGMIGEKTKDVDAMVASTKHEQED